MPASLDGGSLTPAPAARWAELLRSERADELLAALAEGDGAVRADALTPEALAELQAGRAEIRAALGA